ncbi:hypothetical protein PR048_022364, partial [Dryococelus australis]
MPVIPTLYFSDIVYSGISEEVNVQLQRIQNSCIRKQKLKWLDLNNCRIFNVLMLLKKILFTGLPRYFSKWFSLLYSNKRNQITKSHTSFYDSSFTIRTTRIWNELPQSARDAPPIRVFRSLL